jgi:hypothetical protein
MDHWSQQLSTEQRAVLAGLNSPAQIQAYLDQTPYSTEDTDRSPLSVMRDRVAHCLDGGLFAAAMLRRLGHPPLIVDLLPEPGTDDDHVLAIYRHNGHIGALAKSNFAGLRAREPIYRTLRELVLSYFEFFFNLKGQKTLRAYTVPMNLEVLDHLDWMSDDRAAPVVEERLSRLRKIPLITSQMASELAPMDRLTYEAGMLGVNPAGLYKPKD